MTDAHLVSDSVYGSGARTAREHLEGVRRGVLFVLALTTAVFLFVSVGWRCSQARESAASGALASGRPLTLPQKSRAPTYFR